MRIVSVKTIDKAYDIFIESGIFKKLPDIFKEKYHGKKLALVSDSNVYRLYGETLYQNLKLKGFDIIPIVFEAGEERKNLNTLSYIYKELAESAFTRSDYIVALGGGVTGDMAGLAAATFLRGMGFIQVPTSLLAMVDSSIGGKVAVDLEQGKNLVGAFYQPDAVYTDPLILESLTDEQFSNGMAELLKHGFIRDAELLDELIDLSGFVNGDDSLKEDHNGICQVRKAITNKLDDIIMRSCQIKRDVVEQDERDNGIRQLLNFGHTLGHAIERVQNYSGLSHGEAISIGMVIFTRLTASLGYTPSEEIRKLINALKLYNLPTELPDICIDDLVNAISLDKKTRSGKITIAYIEKIGMGKLLTLDLTELEDRIHAILTNKLQTT